MATHQKCNIFILNLYNVCFISQGYEYTTMSGQCCGECVAKQCTMKGEQNTDVNLAVNNHPALFSDVFWSILSCLYLHKVLIFEAVPCACVFLQKYCF